jgi:hypothetical protein
MKASIGLACPRSMAYSPTHTAAAGIVSISSYGFAHTGTPGYKSSASNQG